MNIIYRDILWRILGGPKLEMGISFRVRQNFGYNSESRILIMNLWIYPTSHVCSKSKTSCLPCEKHVAKGEDWTLARVVHQKFPSGEAQEHARCCGNENMENVERRGSWLIRLRPERHALWGRGWIWLGEEVRSEWMMCASPNNCVPVCHSRAQCWLSSGLTTER